MSANLKVVSIYPSNFRDPAAALRSIADRIDAGELGEVGTCAVAIFADELTVYGSGPYSEGPTVHYLFCSAANFMQQQLTAYGAKR